MANNDLEKVKKHISQGASVDLKRSHLPLIEELLNTTKRVCVTDGARTPFANAMRSKTASPAFLESNAMEMSQFVVKNLLERSGLQPSEIEKFGFASAIPERDVTNFAGVLETKVGLRDRHQQKLAIDRRANCITSLVLTENIVEAMLLWDLKVAIVGGAEKLSSISLAVDYQWERLLIRSAQQHGFRTRDFFTGIPWKNPFKLPRAENVITGLNMGQSCELMARDYGVTPLEQAEFAVASHRKAAIARAKGYLKEEIVAFRGVEEDNLIRQDTDVATVMRLRPSFKTPGVNNPTINPGTSSALTDGAAAAVLMTGEEADRRGVTPLAYIVGFEEAKVVDYNREGLLMAPALAIPRLMQRHGLRISDIDIFEIHEPFAAQFFCIDKVVGPLPKEKVNPNGGAIAIGHPFAASGVRYLHSVAKEVHRRSEDLGRPVTALIAVCANEGEGLALLLKS
jgi:acetyl-CoA acetyltransferase family protein